MNKRPTSWLCWNNLTASWCWQKGTNTNRLLCRSRDANKGLTDWLTQLVNLLVCVCDFCASVLLLPFAFITSLRRGWNCVFNLFQTGRHFGSSAFVLFDHTLPADILTAILHASYILCSIIVWSLKSNIDDVSQTHNKPILNLIIKFLMKKKSINRWYCNYWRTHSIFSNQKANLTTLLLAILGYFYTLIP